MSDGLTVQFVGSGDAFGSGGRLQACISVRSASAHVLLDCGATSLVGLKRLGLDASSIDAVVVSHLHGDHFGGLPFLVLDQQFARRERDLVVAGPPGLDARLVAAQEVLFPGSSSVSRRFQVRVLELTERAPSMLVPGVEVTGVPVCHPSGAPAYGLRLACDGRTIGFSGDTEWTDALLEIAAQADLFVCEAYTLDTPVKYHLSLSALEAHWSRLSCRRLVLTHLGPRMLEHPRADCATDGLIVRL
jgi:ribonuclease BN (tRNA processing enzyme)